MKFIDKSCREFTDELASKAPVPGGGGGSALVGAVGIALGMMVGNLTLGNQNYADVENDIKKVLEKAETLRQKLLDMTDEDAKAFEPLARAYKIPREDPSRAQVMEDALKLACTVPMEIMRTCAGAIELCDTLLKIGTRAAISDTGVCAVCCKAALQGASLNVFINIKYMDNKSYAKKLKIEAEAMLGKYCALADEIYNNIELRLK